MKTFSLLILLAVSVSGIRAQSRQADSVLQIVKKHPGDTTGVKALIWLGVQASKDDIQSAQRYFWKALRLAEEISSPKFTAESYNELGLLYHTNGQSDSSLLFYRKVLTIGLTNSPYTVDAYRGIALNLLWLSQFDSARINLQNALSVAQGINDYSLQADVYNDLGNLALEENNNMEALKCYLSSAKLQDSLLNDPVGLARALLNIGNIQYKLKNSEKALQYTTEAQEIARKNGFDKGVAYAFQLKGRIYRTQQKFDEALVEFTKAMDMYKRMGEKRSAIETELSIGNIYYDKGDFNKAKLHYINCLTEAKKISNQTLQIHLFSALGHVYYEQKQYKKAAVYTDSSRITALAIQDTYSLLEAYDLLRGIYEKEHLYKEALDYSMLYRSLNDSLSRAENHAEIQELELKYQTEKKVAEIKLLKSDKSLQEAIISRQQVIQSAIIIVLLLVIVVALVLVNRYRVVNKAKRQVEIERVRNGIARDLHDDIGSTLSSINILSQVALVEKNGNAESYLQRINDQSARMMEDIGDIVWSINPYNDSMKQVIIRMREFSGEIFDSKSMAWSFSYKISDELTLDAEKRKNLFLIFKETANNAAKYSRADKVEISLLQEDHTLVMNVKDNGQGFDEQTIKAGNGLRNLRERAKEIKGEVKLTSTPGKGTEMEFRMPLA